MKTYDNLDILLKCYYPARAYFSTLPGGVADSIRQSGGRIKTAIELIDCAEGMLHEFV